MVLTDLNISQLKESLQTLGLKAFATTQVLQWIYQKKVTSFDAMTNLSLETRQLLNEKCQLSSIKTLEVKTATDQTKLFLFELKDGKKIEAVYIPAESGRITLCLSTQVGCAMACTFCRTGQMGLMRNMTQGEILEQVIHIQRALPEEEITNLVFMGMGEPMANVPNLLGALEILQNGQAFGFGKRRITVSTSGLVPKMYDFMKKSEVKLAISLHATNNQLRDALIPINKRYPLEELTKFCQEYHRNFRHEISYEYVMLQGVNDSMESAKELLKFVRRAGGKVNLIPFNPFPTSDYHPSSDDVVEKWRKFLLDNGVQTNVRANRGRDILAACGQLAA